MSGSIPIGAMLNIGNSIGLLLSDRLKRMIDEKKDDKK
jgi:hypothetical protein